MRGSRFSQHATTPLPSLRSVPDDSTTTNNNNTIVVGMQSGGDYGALAVTHLVLAAFPDAHVQLVDLDIYNGRTFDLRRVLRSGLPVSMAPPVRMPVEKISHPFCFCGSVFSSVTPPPLKL